jgi:hypothetical protein
LEDRGVQLAQVNVAVAVAPPVEAFTLGRVFEPQP